MAIWELVPWYELVMSILSMGLYLGSYGQKKPTGKYGIDEILIGIFSVLIIALWVGKWF